jgi:two-component system, chemotaxis family, chemotaxis protein CheY
MSNDTNTARMVLPEILDLAAAEGLCVSLQQRVSEEKPLGIDASLVETLTVPCVQVLLSAQSYRGGISIENPSVAFTSAFEDLGIDLKWSQGPPGQAIQASEQIDNPVASVSPYAASNGGSQNKSDDSDLRQSSENVMSKRILTIDDSKTMRDMLMLTLAEAGFDVLQAVDGQDGLDVLVNERVDVVITDINMPRMDGYEVIRQLRSNPSHKTTPILVLTTESEADKRNLAREAGATGWMVKPFDPDRLVETVRKVAP